ncbi:MAG: hypothetical protein GY862_25315 [Gammaproteobacteria bacterium]|nr:hypothetical protein [Gammaproteobacteria bacterium]
MEETPQVEDFRRIVLHELAGFREIQAKQTELLERLVAVEVENSAIRNEIRVISKRQALISEEVDKWKPLRKFVVWVGPTGVISLVAAMVWMSGKF